MSDRTTSESPTCGVMPERWMSSKEPCSMNPGHDGEHSWERCPHCNEPWVTHPGGFGGAVACIFDLPVEEGQAIARRVADRL